MSVDRLVTVLIFRCEDVGYVGTKKLFNTTQTIDGFRVPRRTSQRLEQRMVTVKGLCDCTSPARAMPSAVLSFSVIPPILYSFCAAAAALRPCNCPTGTVIPHFPNLGLSEPRPGIRIMRSRDRG